MQVLLNITLQLHRSSTIYQALYRELNGTAVLQSIDPQTEKIRKQKNQNDCSWNRKGPGILLAARISWLDKSLVTFQSESPSTWLWASA